MRKKNWLACFFAAIPFVFFCRFTIALAAASFPKGYLVPTAVSIPPGLSQVERPSSSYLNDSYVLEYNAADNQGTLAISENRANPEWNANKLIRGLEMLAQQSKKGRATVKIRDIDYLEARGSLFRSEYLGTESYDLIMDDDQKVLRIQAQDGPVFHFTDDMVIGVLLGMVRQE